VIVNEKNQSADFFAIFALSLYQFQSLQESKNFTTKTRRITKDRKDLALPG